MNARPNGRPTTRAELLEALEVERFTHLPETPRPLPAPPPVEPEAGWVLEERRDLLCTAFSTRHNPTTLAGHRERAAQRVRTTRVAS